MYRMVDLQRVPVYRDQNNFCAEVSVANLGGGELVGVLAQNRGLVHTDTGTIILVRSKDHGKTWDPSTKVVVMAETADLASEIDLEKAQEARRAAERALEGGSQEPADLASARAQLQQSLLRIRVAERRHREGPRHRG